MSKTLKQNTTNLMGRVVNTNLDQIRLSLFQQVDYFTHNCHTSAAKEISMNNVTKARQTTYIVSHQLLPQLRCGLVSCPDYFSPLSGKIVCGRETEEVGS